VEEFCFLFFVFFCFPSQSFFSVVRVVSLFSFLLLSSHRTFLLL